MLVLALAMHVALGSDDPCMPIGGGPAEGMCAGPVVERFEGGLEMVALLPAAAPGPSLAPEISRTIAALLESRRDMLPTFPPELLVEGATGEFCARFSDDCRKASPLKPWPLGREFTPAQPYLLKDGRVRIEWMRDGKLVYLSFIKLDGAKVRDISTAPAQIPVKRTP